MPESPRFLVSQKEFSKAREIFMWIGKKNGLSEEKIQQRMNKIKFEGEERRTRPATDKESNSIISLDEIREVSSEEQSNDGSFRTSI